MNLKLLGKVLGVGAGAIAMVFTSTAGAIAAETLRLKIGPFQQTVQVADLESYARTGDLPQNLKPYKGFLGSNLRDFLQKSFDIEPEMASQFLDELWRSPMGAAILAQVQTAFPDLSPESLQGVVSLVASQNLEINALNLLRAYPSKELTVDLTAVAGLMLQLNLPNIQSQILSPRITRELETAVLPENFLDNIDPTVAGEASVRRQTIILRDYERERTIPLDIYDSENIKGQLVVLSHGFAANRRFLEYLAYHLASHGYTVVSPDHPGSNVQSLLNSEISLESILPAQEFIDRPKDISFILDELEDLNDSEVFPDHFATEDVTVIGHSFGGYTALALAGGIVDPPAVRTHCHASNPLTRAPGDWLQCAAAELPYGRLRLGDERVKQAIALNPIIGEVFGKDGLSNIDIPTVVLTSTKDAITPSLTHQLQPFQELKSERYLVVASGATHMSVTDLSNRDSLLSQSTLVPEVMGAEAEPVRQMLRAVSLSFLERNGTAGEVYSQFLSAGYVQSLSGSKVQLRLTETISAELQKFLSQLPQAPVPVANAKHSPDVQRAGLFSFWKTSSSPELLDYPTGALHSHLSPLFNPSAGLNFVEPYSVVRLGEASVASDWH
ncbi:MAG: alpha/beta fold hydrolase [Limnothrix sp. RL_2_0]|nr:alpha/beta fold hydrolase [Limnothrix sp. RL_2_0]